MYSNASEMPSITYTYVADLDYVTTPSVSITIDAMLGLTDAQYESLGNAIGNYLTAGGFSAFTLTQIMVFGESRVIAPTS